MSYKYKNKPLVVDQIRFASQQEGMRYLQLKAMLQKGEITRLQLQPSFTIRVEGEVICRYVADFQYLKDGKLVVEDAKGFRTDVYRLKKKLLHACFGIEIQEV